MSSSLIRPTSNKFRQFVQFICTSSQIKIWQHTKSKDMMRQMVKRWNKEKDMLSNITCIKYSFALLSDMSIHMNRTIWTYNIACPRLTLLPLLSSYNTANFFHSQYLIRSRWAALRVVWSGWRFKVMWSLSGRLVWVTVFRESQCIWRLGIDSWLHSDVTYSDEDWDWVPNITLLPNDMTLQTKWFQFYI